ncbi:hypothetical protein EV700_1997 [Fluviicoccus keumensis]|uniref:Uncharacterized protein n=1 Tax=Fluviicoccus keumensis TaxID=1435465 RepID=A0A4Q7Z483_9GAMM|nr:hypothetical protein EV700_1997 [Fluviicoccus keumensis]
MCSAIEVNDHIISFGDHKILPVLLRNGDVRWLRWGERHGVPSPWIAGPCARLDSIQAGKWDRYQPVPVKLPVRRYMERNARNKPYWVRLNEGEYLQGLAARVGDEVRVYVVTVDTPAAYRHVSDRWPRVIAAT